jgi:aminopeptidase
MDKNLLKKYARLIAEVGATVQKGEEVWINADLDQPEFVALVAEECYKLGAKYVDVKWNFPQIGKLTYKYASVSTLSNFRPYAKARYKYMVKNLPTMIHIISDDPDGMKGVNQAKIAKVRMRTYPKIKPFRDAMEDKYKWVIAAVPGRAWAKKVFPSLGEDEAVEALWNAILKTTRVDNGDPVENWKNHNNFLFTQRAKLNDLNLDKLIYKSNNGTDFEVSLIEDSRWCGGSDTLHDGRLYNPNLPTEEIFISPLAGKCSGTVVATKPLSYMGELIEDFSIRFENGRAVEVKARRNQKLLEQMISMDEGAAMLGEVALVPFNSPINETGILFYNTLFDENACCHLALGTGFPMTLKDSANLTLAEIKEKGINDSIKQTNEQINALNSQICIKKKSLENIIFI